MTVVLTGLGTYVPDGTVSGAEIAARSGVPEAVVVEKMGIREKRVCPPDGDHATDMAVAAGEAALADAGLEAGAVDHVRYHGSEYKDHLVWSAAADVTERLGATGADAAETYALCAGAPVAMRDVAALLEAGACDRALLVAASREEDLVDYTDEAASFMFNFGSGASAYVLERAAVADDRALATVLGHDAVTDGSFARDVVMPAGGSVEPPSAASVAAGRHTLTVPDPEGMGERLGEVTLENFLAVADGALADGGVAGETPAFVALTHMKRSFHDTLVAELGVGAEGSHYLDRYGHVQSVDQALALAAARDPDGAAAHTLSAGDLVLLLAAGTGYTWAASALRWRG